ncbi:MAG TPA: proteasome accessory factor PafA2 family protein [Armatimonadota bacterium]|jgi:proteasome accessory factor A
MESRIVGIETEFGCLVHDASVGKPEMVVEAVKDHAFYEKGLGLIDIHARNYAFEPARSGGFLLNGGRLYVDEVGSHEEYATAECRNLFDLVAHDRAGRVILQSVVNDLGLQGKVSFHNNSIDHFGGHTFGCHENYLVAADDRYFRESLQYLLPFLVTRQIFAGVGRVGGHRLNRHDFKKNVMKVGEYEVDYVWVDNIYGVELDDSVDFQLSQRADHILRTVSSRVRFNRAIINPKRDSYYDFADHQRLHLLYGEANMSEYALALKVGTTWLVLDLVEMDALPDSVRLADPLAALKSVSRDQTWKWPVDRLDGSSIGAIDLQRIYLDAARCALAGRDEQTEWVLREWDATLNALEKDPMTLADRLDWVAKRSLLDTYIAEENTDWHDDTLHSLDLEYHNIDPDAGLYYALEQDGAIRRVVSDEDVERALVSPPSDTRAAGRARMIRALKAEGSNQYVIDWDAVYLDRNRYVELRNPFNTYEEEAKAMEKALGLEP